MEFSPAGGARVAAALGAAAAVGPFFAVSVGPIGPGWTGLTESLAPFVDDVAQRLGTAERRVAASIMFQGLAARLVSPVVAGLEQGLVLDLDPSCTAVRSRPGEGLQVRCSQPGGWLSTSAELVSSVLVQRQLRPIVSALAARSPVARGLLWGNVSSALIGALTVLGAGPGSVAVSVVRETLEIGPLAGTLDDRLRRRSCCLFHRAVPGAYCGDCALVGGRVPRA